MKSLLALVLIFAKLALLLGAPDVEDDRTRLVAEPAAVVMAGDPLTGGYRRRRSD